MLYIHGRMQTCLCIYMYDVYCTYINSYVCVRTCTYKRKLACIHVCMLTNVHTYKHAYIHTYIHNTYIHTFNPHNVGHGGALVATTPFERSVVGWNPALSAM